MLAPHLAVMHWVLWEYGVLQKHLASVFGQSKEGREQRGERRDQQAETKDQRPGGQEKRNMGCEKKSRKIEDK